MINWDIALNNNSLIKRLTYVKKFATQVKAGKIIPDSDLPDVNNHIHTSYSFSPYSPSLAVVKGWKAGLKTVGIMDHDSISGGKEFISAARILGIAATVGIECRVNMKGTPFEHRRINNPDQQGISYVSIYGIPHNEFKRVNSFLKPIRQARDVRNRKMVDNINKKVVSCGINIDYDNDVLPLSKTTEGGGVTERHLLFALSKKIIAKYGKENVVRILKNRLEIPLSSKVEGYLNDVDNPFYEYDLLGALKSNLVSSVYVDADEECPKLEEFLRFSDKIGGISAYPYLGDVGDSVTGDKKPQKFEDDYLDELFAYLKDAGMRAITYMPSRNTKEQLIRVQSLADEMGFFKISGEDINTPRQNFICYAQRDEMFTPLYDAAWALIGHETAASENRNNNFFSEKTISDFPDMNERTAYFAEIGKKSVKPII